MKLKPLLYLCFFALADWQLDISGEVNVVLCYCFYVAAIHGNGIVNAQKMKAFEDPPKFTHFSVIDFGACCCADMNMPSFAFDIENFFCGDTPKFTVGTKGKMIVKVLNQYIADMDNAMNFFLRNCTGQKIQGVHLKVGHSVNDFLRHIDELYNVILKFIADVVAYFKGIDIRRRYFQEDQVILFFVQCLQQAVSGKKDFNGYRDMFFVRSTGDLVF